MVRDIRSIPAASIAAAATLAEAEVEATSGEVEEEAATAEEAAATGVVEAVEAIDATRRQKKHRHVDRPQQPILEPF
jgi:hypothetical protein